MKFANVWHHFVTITEHKWLVLKNCFRVGLYRQGLCHDMSKYSPEEFWTGVRYYQGNRSPNAAEREVLARKMDAFCQEQTGMSLREYTQQLHEEQAQTSEMQM